MYLNIVELAESLGVEERTVSDWVRSEQLPHVLDRGRLLFDRHQVVSWAASRGLAAKAGFLAEKHSTNGTALEPLLQKGGIWRKIPAADVLTTFERIVRQLPSIAPPVQQILLTRLRTSEGVNWAPVGRGIALPHLRSPVVLGRDAGAVAVLFLHDALALQPPDEIPVRRLIFFLAPSPRGHLEILARLSRSLSHGGLEPRLREEMSDGEIFKAIDPPISAKERNT
jgi:PTS system nitrogen regulatory IIA component